MATGTSIGTIGFQGKTWSRGETIATLGFISYAKALPAVPIYLWDDLETIPYEYEVHTGQTVEHYPLDLEPGEWTMFSFTSAMILVICEAATEHGGMLILRLTYDGELVSHFKIFTTTQLWIVSANGFQALNDIAEPRIPYQIIPMR